VAPNNTDWKPNKSDCDGLYAKYPQADRPSGYKFGSKDDAALGSYLFVLPQGQGTVWGHSNAPRVAGTTQGLEWGATLNQSGRNWSFSTPTAGGTDGWGPSIWGALFGDGFSHTHGYQLRAPAFLKPGDPNDEWLYFSAPTVFQPESDVRFVNRMGESLYLLNAVGEFMRLDSPASYTAGHATANPMDGTAALVNSIPTQDLQQLHECAKAGFRR
jgi:hypothetical protein